MMQYRIQPELQQIDWFKVLQTVSLILGIAVAIRNLNE